MREAVVAAAVLALAALAAWQATRLPFGALPAPGPGLFPLATSVVILALALILLGQARRGHGQGPAAPPEGPRHGVLKVGMLVAVLVAYCLALEPLGYPLCTFLLVTFMLRVLEPHRWSVALGMAAGTAVASYVLFAIWLRVPLPPGPLGP